MSVPSCYIIVSQIYIKDAVNALLYFQTLPEQKYRTCHLISNAVCDYFARPSITDTVHKQSIVFLFGRKKNRRHNQRASDCAIYSNLTKAHRMFF